MYAGLYCKNIPSSQPAILERKRASNPYNNQAKQTLVCYDLNTIFTENRGYAYL